MRKPTVAALSLPALGLRAWRRGLAAGIVLLALLGCHSAAPARAGETWADGPVRWLLLPAEERKFRRLTDSRQIVQFMEEFWQRRDPDPGSPGNLFLQTFYDRVQAADRLYAEHGLRGSLTDRGRALVLLGPPPILRQLQRPAAGWRPGRAGSPLARETRSMTIEEWEYTVSSLPQNLVEALAEAGVRRPFVVAFAAGTRRTYLVEGGKILDLAARAMIPR